MGRGALGRLAGWLLKHAWCGLMTLLDRRPFSLTDAYACACVHCFFLSMGFGPTRKTYVHLLKLPILLLRRAM